MEGRVNNNHHAGGAAAAAAAAHGHRRQPFRRLGNRATGVTSFMAASGHGVYQVFLSDIYYPLQPFHRQYAFLHLPMVFLLPSRAVFLICVGDFVFLPVKAFLLSVLIVCVAELWEELQFAVMLTALLFGLWSLQRLWRLFLVRWVNRTLLKAARRVKADTDFTRLHPLLRRGIVIIVGRSLHLPIASDPEFVQGTAVMFVRVAVVSDGRPQLRRYALQCVLKAIHNVDDDAQVLSSIFSRMLSCGVTDSLTHILVHGDTEAQRLSIELVCLLARDEATAIEFSGSNELTSQLLSIIHNLASPATVASGACHALANVCSHPAAGFDEGWEGAEVLRIATLRNRPEAYNGMRVHASRALLGLSSPRGKWWESDVILDIFTDLLRAICGACTPTGSGVAGIVGHPPGLKRAACEYFRRLANEGLGTPLFRAAMDRGIVSMLTAVMRHTGEPAAVSEALGAVTALAVSGDASLVNAVSHERAALANLSSLMMFEDRLIRRKALITLLYLKRRLAPCPYDPEKASHSAESRCSICWGDYCTDDDEEECLVVELPDCHHVFHHACVNRWLLGGQQQGIAVAPECPLCKGTLSVIAM